MSTDTQTATTSETDSAHDHDSAHGHGWTDRQYVLLAIFLAVVTALEVYASYADWLGAFFIPSLLIMMVIKFAAVVLFFMHLRFDNKLFSILFYTGIGLALLVYVGTLLTFQFFVG